MIVFHVFKNGKSQCRAGLEGKSALTAIVSSSERVTDRDGIRETALTVSGSTFTGPGSGDQTSWEWVDDTPLVPGDEVVIRILESSQIDPPRFRSQVRRSGGVGDKRLGPPDGGS